MINLESKEEKERKDKEERKKFLEGRLIGIGGSDCPVIMGLSPWKSRLELWHEKVNGMINEHETNDTKWGKLLEPIIIKEYREQTKRMVMTYNEQLISERYPFMLANLDAIIMETNKRGFGVFEAKTKGAYVKLENVMPYWRAQVQHYLAVTGYSWASFGILDFGKKNVISIDIERDEKEIEEIIKKELEFWHLIVKKIPPEADSTDACESFLNRLYDKEVPEKNIDLTANKEASNWASLLYIVRDSKKRIETQETMCKNKLKELMGANETGTGDDYRITWKLPKSKKEFDTERFIKENPDLYQKYLKDKEQTRRFSVRYFEPKEED